MGNKNTSVIGKELNIFLNKFDKRVKVGSIAFTEGDFRTESNFIKALQNIKDLNPGIYTINHDNGLFARFNIENKTIKLHRLSENTGTIMPCWNHIG